VNRKLVVFVPADALDRVRDAVFAAGAGRIGEYERCSWYAEGTGTFFGGEETSPTVGEPGREERVAELRLETVYPVENEAEVVRALLAAHPYEEPAFDLYLLADSPPAQRPVRDSGPGEGVRGNREVPPTDTGASG
jgi:hypothetical protein